MLESVPFLTEIDSRAAVRGSRDPLSLVPIWSAFGRRVVGNLTTASSSLRGFTTLLLGYYCADRVLEKSSSESALNVFLRVEQLVSYSRMLNKTGDISIRGSERVTKRLEDSHRVTLSADPRHQTLSDQKSYGLWGLYTVAARSSGFVLPDRPSLTPEATDFVEREYIHRLRRAGLGGANALVDAVAPTHKELDFDRSHRDLAHSLAQMHAAIVTSSEREFYHRSLVNGGAEQSTNGRQSELADLLAIVKTDDFGMADLRRVIQLAEKRQHEELASRLQSIQRLEWVIGAAANLFNFLLRCDRRTMADVVRDIRHSWKAGLKTTGAEVSDAVQSDVERVTQAHDAAAYLAAFGRHAAGGDWESTVNGLLAFNAFVMQQRGGAPWVRLENGILRVDYREEGADLADPAELEQVWQSTYFINTLHGVQRSLAHN
jgi:hypothetical protein